MCIHKLIYCLLYVIKISNMHPITTKKTQEAFLKLTKCRSDALKLREDNHKNHKDATKTSQNHFSVSAGLIRVRFLSDVCII